jgi:hypothetical protein
VTRQSHAIDEPAAQESQQSASADEHAEDHQRCIPFRRPAA